MADLSLELRDRVNALIESMLQGHRLDNLTISVCDDAAGDEAIFIDLSYKLSGDEFDPTLINKMRSAVRLLLEQNGDERFPYIWHHLQDGQRLKVA